MPLLTARRSLRAARDPPRPRGGRDAARGRAPLASATDRRAPPHVEAGLRAAEAELPAGRGWRAAAAGWDALEDPYRSAYARLRPGRCWPSGDRDAAADICASPPPRAPARCRATSSRGPRTSDGAPA